MIVEESKDIEKILKAAYHEVMNDDLDDVIQENLMDKFYGLVDATIFSDGENELDFECGVALGIKLAQDPAAKLYKTEYDDQIFYLVGSEKDIISKLNTIFDCCCPTDVLVRSGCQCGGN